MEFHPSYARAVIGASRAPGDSPSASSGAISFPQASKIHAPVAAPRPHSSPPRTPRLVNLERRAKFARTKFATA
jgi:hypothetical protein